MYPISTNHTNTEWTGYLITNQNIPWLMQCRINNSHSSLGHEALSRSVPVLMMSSRSQFLVGNSWATLNGGRGVDRGNERERERVHIFMHWAGASSLCIEEALWVSLTKQSSTIVVVANYRSSIQSVYSHSTFQWVRCHSNRMDPHWKTRSNPSRGLIADIKLPISNN